MGGNYRAGTAFLRQVEERWAHHTNGELCLAPEWEGDEDVDEELAGLALQMGAYARTYVDTVAAGQMDATGAEITDVTAEEIADRVAACISILSYGGRRS